MTPNLQLKGEYTSQSIYLNFSEDFEIAIPSEGPLHKKCCGRGCF